MVLALVIFWVFLAGCAGGFLNALISGELHLPRKDADAGVYRPGWVGNVIVGGFAAVIFWGIYGPLASATFVGDDDTPLRIVLRVGEFFGSVVTGIGGGRLLTLEAEKRALAVTKQNLTEALEKLTPQS